MAIIYLVLIWIGASLIVTAITKFAKSLNASPFIVSFFLLGSLTSVAEIGVAINSHIDKTLEISVGNLLGGVIVIFLFIIPLLAVAGNGIKLTAKYSQIAIFVTLSFLVLPSVFFLDSILLKREALFLLGAYLVSVFLLFFTNKNGDSKKARKKKLNISLALIELVKILIGAGVLLWASDNLIAELISFADAQGISPFLISLLTLSIGTNLPELSVAIKSILTGQKDVALANYLGSATFNMLILITLALVNDRIYVDASFLKILLFTVIGLAMFFIFISSKRELSRREGFLLMLVYVGFVLTELLV